MNLIGGSQRKATERVSPCMSDTTRVANTEMVGGKSNSSGRDKKLSSEHAEGTPSLFGENSSTTAVSKASTARRSETKAKSYLPSLSDRLTRSLITSGLVKGTTPSFVRRQCGVEIPDTVFSWRDGGDVE